MANVITDQIYGVETNKAVKVPCLVATTANITLSGEQTIDGVSVTSGARVLVKDQSNTVSNGIWVASTGAWARALDFDGPRDIGRGTRVIVTSGVVNENTEWCVSTVDPITIGTTGLTFEASPADDAATDAEAAQMAAEVAQSAAEAARAAAEAAAATIPTPAVSSQNYIREKNDGTGYEKRTRIEVAADLALRASAVRDHGAIGDDTADDTAAITAAIAAGAFDLPPGIYDTTIGFSAFDGRWSGLGQVRDSDDNLRAPYFSAITAAPAAMGADSSPMTAFNGDLSRVPFAVQHNILGVATLGQPTSGYMYTPEAYPHYTYLYNASGHNEALDSNEGRTAAVAYNTRVYNAGQGDMMAFRGSGFVTGTKSGSTSFLANPAVSLFAGDVTAGADGVYLNPGEMVLRDGGFDVAANGWVINLDRNNVTRAKDAFWTGFRAQSLGTQAPDAAFSASGAFGIGLDVVPATVGAAVTMKADQKIYGNAQATGAGFFANTLGDDWFGYASSISGWILNVGGSSVLQVTNGQVTGTKPIVSTERLHAWSGTAPPAGGSTDVYIGITNVTGFGVYVGTGVPTIAAPQGSLYLRRDGSGTNTRAYISTNNSAGWTALVTAG